MAEPTQDEIDDVINDAYEQKDQGGSRFPGMSYEDGMVAMYDWLTGNTDEHPYPER